MVAIADWLPLAVTGGTFTMLGAFKLYGYFAGVVGGQDKPVVNRLCGT
jgi:hypothetical protein